ncbi:RNA polymerase sigma factor [Flavitalea flava]
MPDQVANNDSMYWSRLKKGDHAALGHLYDIYVDKLFRAALRITDNRELAKDALQEVFIELWNYRETLGDIHHSQSYLVRVLRNILFKKLKKENRTAYYLPDETLVSGEENREELIISFDIDREKKTRLNHALSNLTTRQKLILKLHYYEGLSYEQIADKLSMNYQSVNNLAFRTIMRLRSQMHILIILILLFP